MAPTSIADLSKILTRPFYERSLKLLFPWDGPVDVKFASQFWFRGIPDNRQDVYETYHHYALKPISKVFLETKQIPEFRKYLPDLSDPKYAEDALGLVLLLGHGPRRLYTQGMDARWTSMFFDIACRQLVRKLISDNQLPDSNETWSKLGYAFEDVVVHKVWFYGHLVHSEDLADHDVANQKTEEMRKDIEKYSGKDDPWRNTREKDMKDTTMFYQLIVQGPPDGNSFSDFLFWVLRVFDVHRPIIEEFGHYPYRNIAMGRETTEKEKEWLEKTEYLGQADMSDDEIKRVKQQVKEGVWEALSDKGPQ